MEVIQHTTYRSPLETQKRRQFLIGKEWVRQAASAGCSTGKGSGGRPGGQPLPFLQTIPSGTCGAIGQVSLDETTETSRSPRRSRHHGSMRRCGGLVTLFHPRHLPSAARAERPHAAVVSGDLAGERSYQYASVRQLSIQGLTCALSISEKTGKRTDKRVKSQLQGCGLDCALPVVTLSWRSRQDEHWQHMLIRRPAFGGLAPAQEAFQAQAHQPLIVQLRREDEEAIPLVQPAALPLLRANAQSDCTISKQAHRSVRGTGSGASYRAARSSARVEVVVPARSWPLRRA